MARAAAGLVCATAIVVGVAWAEGPSFDCSAVEPGSIGALICDDAELSAIDRTMAEVYAAASAKAVNERPPVLKVEQRGWIKGRDDCWKNDDVRGCVEQAYRLRVAELQAQYRLVPERGPVTYVCDGQPANQVIATFFETDPPTLIAERGDQVSLMFLQAAASGSKYQGRNEMLWEHHGEAVITWGFDSPKMHCAVSGLARTSHRCSSRGCRGAVPSGLFDPRGAEAYLTVRRAPRGEKTSLGGVHRRPQQETGEKCGLDP